MFSSQRNHSIKQGNSFQVIFVNRTTILCSQRNKIRNLLNFKDQLTNVTSNRFEVNNNFLPQLEKSGLVISGFSEDKTLVEIIEIPKNKWFIAAQFHPEFTSTPRDGHPLFEGFVDAAKNFSKLKLN